jgi:hypothetical protein
LVPISSGYSSSNGATSTKSREFAWPHGRARSDDAAFSVNLRSLAWLKVIESRKSQRRTRSRLLLPRRAKRARLLAGSHRSDQEKRNRTHGSFDESWTLTSASSVMVFNHFSNRVSVRGNAGGTASHGLNRLPAVSEELYLIRSFTKVREPLNLPSTGHNCSARSIGWRRMVPQLTFTNSTTLAGC